MSMRMYVDSYVFVPSVLVSSAFGLEMNLGSNPDFTNCAVG